MVIVGETIMGRLKFYIIVSYNLDENGVCEKTMTTNKNTLVLSSLGGGFICVFRCRICLLKKILGIG